MKTKLLFLILLLSVGLATVSASDIQEQNRVVMAMPHHFDKIVVNGDMTVEVTFDKNYKGYVVYNTADTLAQKLHCVVDSTSTLYVTGESTANAVKSRVVIVACDSVTKVINNLSGTILIKKLPRVADICLISNGDSEIKCDEVSAGHLMLSCNSEASMAVNNAKARFADIFNNASGALDINKLQCHGTRILNNSKGSITIESIRTRRGEILNNASGKVSVSGNAKAFAIVNYADGLIDLSGFNCKKQNTANYGTGTISK